MAFEDAPTGAEIGLGMLTSDQPSAAEMLAAKAAREKTWKILKQKHEYYDDMALDHCKADYLYEGGFQMNTKEVAQLFCPKMRTEESNTVYQERIGSAAYVPTFSKLITGLISNLFSEDLAVMEAADHDDPSTPGDEFTDKLRDYYKLFENDCDGNGMPLHDFMRFQTTKALVHQFCYFGVDFPREDPSVKSQLELEQRGLDKPRLYKIDAESVYDYQYQEDSEHEFSWIKMISCIHYQPTAFDPPMMKFLIKCWSIDPSGFAKYACYLTRAVSEEKELKDKEIIPLVDEGITSFKRIPVFCFRLDDGVAVGTKLAPMAAEHFNRTTIENHSTNKACLTVPTIYRGDMLPGGADSDAIPNVIMFDNQRGQHPRGRVNENGVVELGKYTEDRFEIVEAEGKALAFIHKQNEDLDEKMHSVVHQMGQSIKQSQTKSGKSGLSKQEDRRATEMLLTALADEVYSIVGRIFKTIADSRGEDIVWDVKGLSATAQEDRLELVQEVMLLPTMNFPSTTFMKEYNYRIGSRLIEGTDQRTLQTIRAEIEESLDANPNVGQSGKPLSDDPAQDMQGVSGKPSPKAAKSDEPEMKIGKSGNQAAPSGSHLASGEHTDWHIIFDMLKKDYKEKDLAWVKSSSWRGPMEIDINDIDFSGEENWKANKPGKEGTDKVEKFTEVLSDKGFSAFNPVILANMPNNDEKYTIIDGRHRVKAAQASGVPVLAYIADVGSVDADTPHMQMHGKQVGSNNSSG